MRETTVSFGQQRAATGHRGQRIQLRGDGQISRSEAAGVKRVEGFVTDICSPQVEEFIRSGKAEVFGPNWQTRSDASGQVADSGDNLVVTWGTQQVAVHPEQRRVTLDSQGEFGEHTIEARYDAETGKVARETVRESYSPVDLSEGMLWAGAGFV